MSADGGNGNAANYARVSEIVRLEQRIEEVVELSAQKDAEIEQAALRGGSRHAELRGDVHALKIETNSLRLSFDKQMGDMRASIDRLTVAVQDHLLRLL